MSEKGQISISAQNIFPIIKKWLYSEREIFLRELVSNGVDAITKLKILAGEGQTTLGEEELGVKVSFSADLKTITVEDNGVGMTADEVRKYLGQIAFSGAEEFIAQYQSGKDGIIGHFGLGFYSAFMISRKVEVETLSWREGAAAVRWSCTGEPEFTVEESTKADRGTRVILHVADDDAEFLDNWKLREILRRYCRFLPVPIRLGDEVINPDPPLWVSKQGDLKDEDYVAFYKKMFPTDEDPYFWVHVNADFPFHLQGVLFFPRLSRQDDLRSDRLHLYCNRVFVSSEMNVLLPEAFQYIRGFIDSPDIPLNVSRSFLQQDASVRKIAAHLSRKIADRIVELNTEKPEEFRKMWKELHPYVKFACMRDDKFAERVAPALVYEKSDGAFTSLEEALKARYGEDYAKSQEEKHLYYAVPGETLKSLIHLYEEAGLPVILASPPIDSHYFNYYESRHHDEKISFRRVDANLGPELVAELPEVVDVDGRTDRDRVLERAKSLLPDVTFEVQKLKTTELPLVLVIPELQRRFKEMLAYQSPKTENVFGAHQCVLNLRHPVIERLDPAHPHVLPEDTAKEVLSHLYDLALLPHRKLDPEAVDRLFVQAGGLLARLSTPA